MQSLGAVMVGAIGDHADLQLVQRLVAMPGLGIMPLLMIMRFNMTMQMRPGQLAQSQQQAQQDVEGQSEVLHGKKVSTMLISL